MEFSSIAQLGAKTLISGPTAPEPNAVQVKQVDPKPAASNTGGRAGEHPDQDAQAAAGRDIMALRRAVAEGDRPAGPPPSFDVSFLEADADLQQKIARMEAARTSQRDAEALQAPPQTPAPHEKDTP